MSAIRDLFPKVRRLLLVVCLCAETLCAAGADLSGRKFTWAHYVAWYTPDMVSLVPERFYNEPLHDRGEDSLRDEVRRALATGIDGFFVDVIALPEGESIYGDLRPFLKAAEGTDFQVAICLDRKTTVGHQVDEFVRMLRLYGNHPNYPKMGGKYVVGTYTYLAWSAAEWAEIRKGCADAGYPLYLVANVERMFDEFTEAKLAEYADQFEAAYYFSFVAKAFSGRERLADVLRRTADFCDAHGKMFMPCLWPGYFGGWMRTCIFQPHVGFDTLHARFAAGWGERTDWLHLTTWNDHDETTLEPRRLTTGLRRLIRAYSRAFKGLPPPEDDDVQFAYLRETVPGTVHRFEALRPPTAVKGPCRVVGRLRDFAGKVVATLPVRTFADEPWARVEWLVPTTELAASPVLVPEFAVKSATGVCRAVLPPVFLFTPFLRSPETVKVSVLDRRRIGCSLDVSYSNGVLAASCDYPAAAPVRRATLYMNERPVGLFGVSTNTILPLTFGGEHTVRLTPENGTIDCAVKLFEKNNSTFWWWNGKGLQSNCTAGWMRFAARIACTPETRLTFESAGQTRTFTPEEGIRAGMIEVGGGHVGVVPEADCTLRDLEPKGAGRTVRVRSRAPKATDAFWVQFEFTDGTHGESRVLYPFAGAEDVTPREMNVVETPVTMDWLSAVCGQPGARPCLTPEEEWPVRETRVVAAKVSPLSIRRHAFSMAGSPRPRAQLPYKQWPMGTFALVCTVIPHARDGAEHPLLVKDGWQEGPELTLLSDGRLCAAYAGGDGADAFRAGVTSQKPLSTGVPVRVGIASDCRELRLCLDGVLQGAAELPARRVYGNLSPKLGAGVNGEKPSVAELFDLSY